jgi:hypothetical protein
MSSSIYLFRDVISAANFVNYHQVRNNHLELGSVWNEAIVRPACFNMQNDSLEGAEKLIIINDAKIHGW